MRCPICETTDGWENVDQYRIKAEGMSLCGTCGFISYPKKYKTKEQILEYYRNEYRAVPSAGNIFTGERKLHYHAHFLQETLEKWKAEGREEIVVADVGAAIGMFLNWIRDHFPNGTYKGVELTRGYVRNAYHLFKLELDEEFDDSIQYDLITSFKTLEHMLDPDKELRRYIKALKPDGVLNFSVPIWFDVLSNFGMGGFDIDTYFHPDHINTWTKKQVEGLIKYCGGKIVKENHSYYGDMYLIMRDDSAPEVSREIMFEDPIHIKLMMQKIFDVNEAYQTNQYGRAIELWPNFPIAWAGYYEMNRKNFHELGINGIEEKLLKPMLEACPNSSEVYKTAANIFTRYEQYERALEHLSIANQLQPNQAEVLSAIAICYRELAKRCEDKKDKLKFTIDARNAVRAMRQVSTQAFAEATNWLMFDNAQLPTAKELGFNGR